MGQASARGQQRASQSRLRSAGGAQVAGLPDIAPAPPAAPAAAHPCGGDPAAPDAAPSGAGCLAHAPLQHCAARQPGLGSTSPSLACNFHRVYPKAACPRRYKEDRAQLHRCSPFGSSTVPAHAMATGEGAHHEFCLALQRTSAENPLLLIETPVGGAGPSPTWNMDGPAPAQGARRGLAASCPTSPTTAFLKAARPNTVCQAGLIRSARGVSSPQDASSRRQAKRQLFVQAADLAADLARLRKRIRDRLLQLPVCAGAEISPSLGCSAANSGAISLASACSRDMGASLAASPAAMSSFSMGTRVGTLQRTAPSESGDATCIPSALTPDAEEQLSVPDAAVLATSPDLASMPPRIQRIAQVCLLLHIQEIRLAELHG